VRHRADLPVQSGICGCGISVPQCCMWQASGRTSPCRGCGMMQLVQNVPSVFASSTGNCGCLSICLEGVRTVAIIVVKGNVTIEFGKGQLLESRGRQQHVKPAIAELHAMCNSCTDTMSRALVVGQTLESFKNSPLSSLGRDMCCAQVCLGYCCMHFVLYPRRPLRHRRGLANDHGSRSTVAKLTNAHSKTRLKQAVPHPAPYDCRVSMQPGEVP
jgi:hypothetical protein